MSNQRAEDLGNDALVRTASDLPAGLARSVTSSANADDILASISDGLVALDNDWRVVYVNPAAQRMWNRDLRELLGKTIHEALDISEDNPFRALYSKSKRNNEPIAISAYSDVFAAWVDVRGFPHPGGYTILFRPTATDKRGAATISSSERERDAIRSINQRIFDTSLDLILVVDKHGVFLRVSPSSHAILGYAPDEMVGHNGKEFVYPDDLESTRGEMRLARHGGLSRTFQSRYSHRTGYPVTLAWTGIWSQPDGQYFFIGRDMTDRIALESQLRQSQKMEAVGQLTGGVAHDFNNLLTVIIGMTELLSDAIGDNPLLGPTVRAIDEAASRGAQLTQRMLAFARKQPLQSRNIDLNEIVTRAGGMLQRTIGEDIHVKLSLEANLWQALADPSQIEDVILNLAVNARDAMPNGGKLTVRTANVTAEECKALPYKPLPAAEYVMVEVSDTGTGIPKEIIEKIFEPFFTTKETGKGTGLGLSTVYGIVKQTNGYIFVDSTIGKGTSFRIFLPRHVPAAGEIVEAPPLDAKAAEAKPMADLTGHGTILLVEDEEGLRSLNARGLTSRGYTVLEAGNGLEAIALIESHGGAVDLVVSDVVMPEMDGPTLLTKLRSRDPGVKIIFVSGYAEEAFEKHLPEGEKYNFLAKPFTLKQLVGAVKETTGK